MKAPKPSTLDPILCKARRLHPWQALQSTLGALSALAVAALAGVARWLPTNLKDGLGLCFTLRTQNLLFCRVPKNTILGFIIRTYKKLGFGFLR